MLNLNLCGQTVTLKFGKTQPIKADLSTVKGMTVLEVIEKFEEDLGIDAETINKVRGGKDGLFSDIDLDDEIGALTYLLYQSISDKG